MYIIFKRLADWVLICRSGRWIGYVNDQPLKDLPVQKWDLHSLAEYTHPLSDLPSVGEKTALWEAVLALERSKEGGCWFLILLDCPQGLWIE